MKPLQPHGRRFNAALALRGINLTEALERTGLDVSRQTIDATLRTEAPRLASLQRLALLADCRVADLVGDDNWPWSLRARLARR